MTTTRDMAPPSRRPHTSAAGACYQNRKDGKTKGKGRHTCRPFSNPTGPSMPVGLNLVVVVSALARPLAVVLGQFADRVGRRRLELLFGVGHDERVLLGVVVKDRPRQRVEFLAHPEDAAEADDCEHDLVVGFLE